MGPFYTVLSWYSNEMPEVNIYLGDNPNAEWNVSRARNIGCRNAINDNCDVIIVTDADIFVKIDVLKKAIDMALDMGQVILPYTELFSPSEDLTEKIVTGEMPVVDVLNGIYDRVNRTCLGGIYVMTPEVFKKMNGWDERFKGWGYEDDAFCLAHLAVFDRQFARVNSCAVSLFHRDRELDTQTANKARFDMYVKRSNNIPNELLEIIKGNMVD